ncbi:zinc-dependent metalloprotease [Pedobacter sp. MC2016-24]|uniref:zinc-dependent metalloprotease n=1 Tax=Pedobacter sp. MC2016-24 TaxID=2780090 RepID=UPI001882A61A|nr:zinc-dependent metalloprotease [Pedobacter sp. MC2016-24]MBE9598627.1 zinc-dependent metalloprotease [Pedobacter sp. MC2016-24]
MKFALSILFCAISLSGYAQDKTNKKIDSTQVKAVVSYEKLIPKTALSKEGMFDVKSTDNKWYFEIPDSLLNRYILAVTRYVAMPQGAGSFGGEKANEQTVYFEKGNGNKIFLRAVVYRQDVKDEQQQISRAVASSQVNPIVAAFDIKSKNPATGNSVIDVTDLLRKESNVLSISQQEKTEKKLGGLADDRSFIESVHTYPMNIEIRTTKTYATSGVATITAGALTGSVTVQLNTSLVLLPKVPMRKRLSDERVGYFANKYTLFDENKQVAQPLFFIQRYRLEPKDKDLAKYKKGELVEPKKQIVYYIDPATPKKWRKYLIAGVNDWQKAFEQAGFKNAIVAKEWPEADTTMSLEDARYSVIRYYASETPNAYGPRISDPRSGEIIESHVGWFHNVMKLVHNWYMIQAGALDPRARKMEFDDELMGELIRFVSSHEIGHTLGLRHNMGASSQTPVEKLRDKKWVEANGHTVSIMDYARFNYVAQPEDHIGPAGIYPRIGMYDKWAIQWGYKYLFGAKDEFEEQAVLNKMTIDSLTKNPRLWFGGEGKDEDPRSQTEDLGDDAIVASEYGIKNLQRVVPNLISWTYQPGDLYDNLKTMHKAVVSQYSKYLYHVMKNIGNRYITQRSTDEKGFVYTEVPKAKVKSVIGYLDRQVFEAPLWMYPKEIAALIDIKPVNEIMDQQNQMLNMLLSSGLVFNLEQRALSSADPYPVAEYLNDLEKAVWKNLSADPVRSSYRRSMQRGYVEKLNNLINPKDMADGKMMSNAQRSDVRIAAILHAKHLRTTIATMSVNGDLNLEHQADMLSEIDKIIARIKKD